MGYKKTLSALSLLGLSALLAACDAITAQHIPSTTLTAFNNGAGLGGRGAQMGMPGSLGGIFGGRDGVDRLFDADEIGRIVAVSADSLTLELVKQGSADAGGTSAGGTDWTSTGRTVTLKLDSGVSVSSASGSERTNRPGSGGREAEPGDLAGLKAGRIVTVWYKEGTETAERIRILE